MRTNQLEMKTRVEKIREHIIKNGTTKGLVLTGINCDESFISFIKSNANKFKDIKFLKRGSCEEKDN